jgi:hypothetical protein
MLNIPPAMNTAPTRSCTQSAKFANAKVARLKHMSKVIKLQEVEETLREGALEEAQVLEYSLVPEDSEDHDESEEAIGRELRKNKGYKY